MTQDTPQGCSPGTNEPMNVTEPIRCGLARAEAGYESGIELEDIADLLDAYDRLVRTSAQEHSDGYFDMLWAWFTERRSADDMRANATNGGLSADDFKQMLDEHELNIMPPQPASVAQAAPDLTDPVVVHANMLRGTIAKPTWEQIKHLYAERFTQGGDKGEPVVNKCLRFIKECEDTGSIDHAVAFELVNILTAPQPASIAYQIGSYGKND